MSDEEEPEQEVEQEEQEQQEQEQQEEQEEQEERPVHKGCGAKLEKGMKFCPACGQRVDESSYK